MESPFDTRRRELPSGFELAHDSGRLEVHELAPGVLLQEYEDGVLDSYFDPVAKLAERRIAQGVRVTLISDITRSRSHTPSYRQAWAKWIREHGDQIDAVLVLMSSPMQRMAVNAASAATGGNVFKAFTDLESWQNAVERAVLLAEASAEARRLANGEIEVGVTPVSGQDPRVATIRLGPTVEDDEPRSITSNPVIGRLANEPEEGTEIAGAYRLDKRIGRGGMGTVYRGLQHSLQRDVAIKLIRFDRRDNPQAFSRFQREIDVVAHLSHPNIVQIIDAGTTEDGTSYLVMELLEGLPLTHHVPPGGLEPGAAVELFQQLCAGVNAAHAKHLIHRDLTPGNAFVSKGEDGMLQVKVLDFGLAKSSKSSDDSILTMEGQILGTPGFMAPEQIDQEHDIDERTDIYSLGALLYYSLTGRRPFTGKSPGSIFVKQLAGNYRPISRDAHELAPFRKVIAKALAVAKSERYATVDELWQAVEQAGQRTTRKSRSLRARTMSLASLPEDAGWSAWVWLVIGVSALTALVVSLWLMTRI